MKKDDVDKLGYDLKEESNSVVDFGVQPAKGVLSKNLEMLCVNTTPNMAHPSQMIPFTSLLNKDVITMKTAMNNGYICMIPGTSNAFGIL
jgi:hypothetical protein